MDGDLKWVLIAAAVIFFLSRLLSVTPSTSASMSKSSASVINSAPIVKNQVITTQIIDSNGRVIQTGQAHY